MPWNGKKRWIPILGDKKVPWECHHHHPKVSNISDDFSSPKFNEKSILVKKNYKTKMSPHFLNLQFMQHLYDFSFSREFGTQWLPTNNQKNLVLFSVAQPIINHHKGQKKKFSRSKKKELKKKTSYLNS